MPNQAATAAAAVAMVAAENGGSVVSEGKDSCGIPTAAVGLGPGPAIGARIDGSHGPSMAHYDDARPAGRRSFFCACLSNNMDSQGNLHATHSRIYMYIEPHAVHSFSAFRDIACGMHVAFRWPAKNNDAIPDVGPQHHAQPPNPAKPHHWCMAKNPRGTAP